MPIGDTYRVVSSGQEGSRSKNETLKVRAVRYY